MVYQLEKLLKENADKIGEADQAPIKSAIERVKQAASKDDVAEIRRGHGPAGAGGPRHVAAPVQAAGGGGGGGPSANGGRQALR